MRTDVMALLEEAEKKTGVPTIRLLVRAVRKLVKHSKKYIRFSGRIRYQKRFDEKTKLPIPKKRVKVRLWERDYYYGHLYKPFFSYFHQSKKRFYPILCPQGNIQCDFFEVPLFSGYASGFCFVDIACAGNCGIYLS
jgi:hypothetical protein